MKNASMVEYKPTAIASLPAPHRPPNLHHQGWMLGPKLTGFKSGAIELLALLCHCLCWFWLVGRIHLSKRPFGHPISYNVMHLQLGNCPIVAFWPTTNNKQRTNQIHAGCYKVVDLNPTAAI